MCTIPAILVPLGLLLSWWPLGAALPGRGHLVIKRIRRCVADKYAYNTEFPLGENGSEFFCFFFK